MRRDKAVWAILVAGPLLLFGPMLIQGRVLFWGTPLLQFVPWHRFALDVLREGAFPLWNPLLGMGAPLLANHQSALLYPPNWLIALLGPAYGEGFLVALHLVWAGLGTALLVRRLGMGRLAQLVAGLAYSLSGYMVARAWFISINHAAAWLPWAILGVEQLVGSLFAERARGGVWRWTMAMSLILAMQWLAGHAQTAWYSLLLILVWAAWRAHGWAGLRGLRTVAWPLALSGLLALGLAAAQILPTAEYMLESYRAESLDPAFAMNYSFWPWRLLGLFAPDLFGNPARGTYWGYGNYWEDAIYIGILPVLWAFSGLWRSFRKRTPHASLGKFLGGVVLVSILLALGKNTPLFPFLFRHVPTFDLFQAPARWNLLTTFGLALLAAIGAEGWSTPKGRGLYWTRLGTAGAGAIGLAGVLGGRLLGEIEPTFIRAFGIMSLWLTLAGLLTLFGPKRGERAHLLAGGILLADLLLAGWGLNPSTSIDLYRGPSALAETVSEDRRIYMPLSLEESVKYERSHRFDAFKIGLDWRRIRDVGLPNASLLDGIRSANNFDPLLTERYTTWMQAIEGAPEGRKEDLLRLMDVGWQAVEGAGGPLGVEYQPVSDSKSVRFFARAMVAEEEAALGLLLDPTFDLENVLILDRGDAREGATGGEVLELNRESPQRITLVARAPHPGTWVLISESWYPGWKAYIDGQETPLYRGDYLFQALWVPGGEHQVSLRYAPASFLAGSLITLTTLLLLGAGWAWRVRQS